MDYKIAPIFWLNILVETNLVKVIQYAAAVLKPALQSQNRAYTDKV